MKRIITLIMLVCIMLFACVTAIGEGVPKAYCDNVQCNSGETVSYSVHISGNTGMAAFLISIGCESDWLYFDETAERGNFTDKGSIDSSCDARRLNAMWYDVDGVSDDGTLFTVNVHVSPSAPSGDYPIEIAYSPENTLDMELNEFELEAVGGCITVTHIDVEKNEGMIAAQNDSEADNGDNTGLVIGISAVVVAVVIILFTKKKQKTHD